MELNYYGCSSLVLPLICRGMHALPTQVVDNDQGGVISFSEFFAFIIMIKRLTPRITELYHKERSALRIQVRRGVE